jgi:hypothetical protein
MLKECYRPPSPQDQVDFAILLREPIERLGSTFLFFMDFFKKIVTAHAKNEFDRETSLSALAMVNKNASAITAQDFRTLCETIADGNKNISHEHPPGRGYLSTVMHSYQGILAGKKFYSGTSNREAVQRSVSNLHERFQLVGITEHMPAFYTLVSKKYNINLNNTCDKYIMRNTVWRNNKLFGTLERPKTRDMFNSEVVNYLETELLAGETEIYDAGGQMFVKQLAHFNLTIESATSIWNANCAVFGDIKRRFSTVHD